MPNRMMLTRRTDLTDAYGANYQLVWHNRLDNIEVHAMAVCFRALSKTFNLVSISLSHFAF